MQHLFRIDIEDLATAIYRSVIEKISGQGITYGDTEETRIEVICQDSEDETKADFIEMYL